MQPLLKALQPLSETPPQLMHTLKWYVCVKSTASQQRHWHTILEVSEVAGKSVQLFQMTAFYFSKKKKKEN